MNRIENWDRLSAELTECSQSSSSNTLTLREGKLEELKSYIQWHDKQIEKSMPQGMIISYGTPLRLKNQDLEIPPSHTLQISCPSLLKELSSSQSPCIRESHEGIEVGLVAKSDS